MRARLVEANFERGERDPKTTLEIGRGPGQHIEGFEKILDTFNLDYERDEEDEDSPIVTWMLIDADFGPLKDKTVFLHKTRNRKGGIGWHFRPFSERYFDDPYAILEWIVKSVLEGFTEELEDIKTSARYYEDRIAEIEDGVKKLNLNI